MVIGQSAVNHLSQANMCQCADAAMKRLTIVTYAIIFDCEFVVREGAQQRFWCGPLDPDPVIAQIGAVKVSLEKNFPILDTFKRYVTPKTREGKDYNIDPFFTRLTGITAADISENGIALSKAISQLGDFAGEANLWSWGKDELNMMAISCYIEGIEPEIPATRFGNACQLLLEAGMLIEDLYKTRSSGLADYFGVKHPPLKGHDALDDALSISYAIQHLLRTGKLSAKHFG